MLGIEAFWRRIGLKQKSKKTPKATPNKRGVRPAFEVLEDRTAPAVLTVNSVADNTSADSSLTLREAILLVDGTLGRSLTLVEQAQVNGALGTNDTIVFKLPSTPQTINLTGGALDITSSLKIIGPGSTRLTINGNNLDRDVVVGQIFTQDLGLVVSLSGMTLTRGSAAFGAGLLNFGTLTLDTMVLSNNTAVTDGGAIYNVGALTVTNSSFLGNSVSSVGSVGSGGALDNISSGTAILSSCNFTGNKANGSGANAASGAGIANSGVMDVSFSSLVQNTAASNGGGIYNSSEGNLTLTTCLIANNRCGSDGGGIDSDGTMTATNVILAGNFSASEGGGMDSKGTLVNFTDCLVVRNTAVSPGGGLKTSGQAQIVNSRIIGNRVTSGSDFGNFGGGIATEGVQPHLSHTIVAGNFQGLPPGTTANDIDGTVDPASDFNIIGVGGSGGLTNGVNNNQVGVPPPAGIPGTLAAVKENSGAVATATISTLLKGQISDADPSLFRGIAVIGLAGRGRWQFSVDGINWTTISNVSKSHALLLPATDRVRYIPAVNESGQSNLWFVAWDGSTGSAGKFVSISSLGGVSSFSANSSVFLAPVTHINLAPAWKSTTAYLTPVLPGSYTLNGPDPAGDKVSDVFGSFFSDLDFDSVGVAIIGATGTAGGTWEYSIDGGANWITFGSLNTTFRTPSMAKALLLSADHLLRFVPNAGFAGIATVTALAWDGTQGAALAGSGKGFAITATGGNTAFSAATLTARCAVNNAPALGNTSGLTLAAITEGGIRTVAVSTLLSSAQASDMNAGAMKGIAIVGTGGNGQWPGFWQYSLDAMNWFNVPPVSESVAFLLPNTASLRFRPAIQASNSALTSPATLTYRAWDQTAGTAGKLFSVAGTDGATPFSAAETAVSVPVTFVNHAPTWLGSTVNLTPIVPGTTNPAGDKVSDVFGSFFKDVDGDNVGVAIIGVTGAAGGTWEYSIDSGANWITFGSLNTTFRTPSMAKALLLSADHLLRFVPNAGFAGVATVTALAWDGTQGAALAGSGKGFAITSTGGNTAFSAAALTARCAVNNAPALGNTSGLTLAAITEGGIRTVGVSTLLSSAQASDMNAGAMKGIAIVGMGGNGQWPGVWQYTLDGLNWFNVPPVSEAFAFLLPSTASLRFQAAIQASNSPNAGPATLTCRAWDQTAGTTARVFAVAGTGGATPLSDAETVVSVPVNFINHAPSWLATAVNLTPILPGTSNPAGNSVADLAPAFKDLDSDSVGVAIVSATGTTNGTWQYSTDGGANWTSFGAVGTTFGVPSKTKALLLSANDLVRFVPNAGFVGSASLGAYAWDGTQGAAADPDATTGFSIAATGGSTAFSTTTLTATIVVDTAPVLLV